MNIMDLPFIMLRCLILTIILEVFIAIFLKYRLSDLITITLANIITNPFVVSISLYFNIKYGVVGRNYSLLVLELLVIIVEGFIYYKFIDKKKINPFILSLILNFISFWVGEIVNIFL